MLREKKTWIVNSEKQTFPMVVRKVKTPVPLGRTVRLKKRIKGATSNDKSLSTASETSGNVMRLCVNLMPLLAAARELMNEEEDEGDSSWKEKKQETSHKGCLSFVASEEQTVDSNSGFSLHADSKQAVSLEPALPPLTQPEGTPECLKMRKCSTPLPPISPLDQTKTDKTLNCTFKDSREERFATRGPPGERPWIDNPLFSKCRSAEFRLPDISLSSLDALLQTVTQKLRRKRRGRDEELLQSDQLLMSVSDQRLRERRAGQHIGCYTKKNSKNIAAATKESVCDHRLPPLFPTPKPALVLSVTKRNLLIPNTLL